MKTIELDVSEYGFVNDGKGIDEPINNILSKYRALEYENKLLHQENIKLKSEHYKDEELEKLRKENEELRKGFHVSDLDFKKIKNWMQKHECSSGNNSISEYRFAIIPGIGYNAYVKCNCGKEYCFYKE